MIVYASSIGSVPYSAKNSRWTPSRSKRGESRNAEALSATSVRQNSRLLRVTRSRCSRSISKIAFDVRATWRSSGGFSGFRWAR